MILHVNNNTGTNNNTLKLILFTSKIVNFIKYNYDIICTFTTSNTQTYMYIMHVYIYKTTYIHVVNMNVLP